MVTKSVIILIYKSIIYSMKKKFRNLVALVALTSIFASCTNENKKPENEAGKQVEITHELGTTKVSENPQKVVVFDIGTLETLNDLGIKVVGVPKDYLPDHLEKFKTDDSVANVGSVKEPNLEKVNELNPDLIIISARLSSYYDELSKIAPTIYMGIDTKNYLKSFKENTTKIGQLFHKEDLVKEKLKSLEDQIAKEKEVNNQDTKKALIVLYNNGKFSAYGKGSRFGFIHDVLGVKAVDDNLEVATHGQPISNEFIEKANPDYLFIVDRSAVVNKQPTNKEAIENALIQKTNAYKNGKIIYLNPQVWYISGGGLTSTQLMLDEIKNALK